MTLPRRPRTPRPPQPFARVYELSEARLRDRGCWAAAKPRHGRVLMLFPKDWYDDIPDGFVVENIFGEHCKFKHGKTDDDTRFGMLAYGVRVKATVRRGERAS